MHKILTLCLIKKNNQVLLGLKKRGFGIGRWNGFGGKVEKDESIEQAALREVWEEAGIKLNKIEEFGKIDFDFLDTGDLLEVHFFRSEDFSGEPKETEEMKPQWFAENEIPFSQMWPDDPLWFPLFLANKKFTGRVVFGNIDTIVSYDIKEVL